MVIKINCPECDLELKEDAHFCKLCRFDVENKKIYQPEEKEETLAPIACSKCKHKNENSKFCVMCGTMLYPDLFLQCAHCNHLNPNDAKFCTRCSKNLEEGEKIISCPKCKHENKSPARFCLKCGTELDADITFCQACGAKNHIESKFCMICGEAVKKRPESCPKCGSSIAEEMKFCMQCGTKVEV